MEDENVHKSEKLAEIAREAGWETKLVPEIVGDELNPKTKWNLYCSRKPSELLQFTYENNRLIEALYCLGEKVTTPPHKAAVVKILLGTPKLTSKNVDAREALAHRTIPFDPEDAMPSRILDELLGKTITWLNSISTELESANIERHRNRGSRYYRIFRTADRRRYIEFVTAQGFRSVYLDAIVTAN